MNLGEVSLWLFLAAVAAGCVGGEIVSQLIESIRRRRGGRL